MSRSSANRIVSFLKISIISLLMVIAALGGIYSAKLYTNPYSGDIISELSAGTLLDVEIDSEKCNILILGTDKAGALTDVMMLAQIDPINDRVTVMSIPRDTRVKYRGSWMKINQVHSLGLKKGESDGIEASILAVKELTGVPIHHFVKVNFNAFRECIDELGGVDFNVPQRMLYKDPYQDLYIDLQAGMQHLDGDKSEQLVRFRRYKNGDIDRIKVQQDFLHALADQQLKITNVGKIDNLYRIVAKDMETSMTIDDAVQVMKQILSIGKDKIETITLPNTPQYIGGASYVIPVKEEIAKVCAEKFGVGIE